MAGTAVRGLTIELGLDSNKFDNSIKGINKNLKNTNSNLNALNKLIRVDPTNIEALTRKQGLLTNKVKDSNDKLGKLNDELSDAKKKLKLGKIGQKEFDKIQRSIDTTEAGLIRTNKELKKTAKRLAALKVANLTKLSTGFKKMGRTLTRTLTPAILGAFAAVAKLTNDFINAGDEIAKTAKKMQTTSEALQEWRFIAERSGVSNSALEKSFMKVNAAVADVVTETTGPAADALRDLGISQEFLEEANLSAAETYDLVILKLSEMEDEVLRTSIANEIFGDKTATELTPILLENAEAISALKEEARELGIISNEDAAQAEALADMITNLKQEFGKLAANLAISVIPLFKSLVAWVKEKIIPIFRKFIDKWSNLTDGQKKTRVALLAVLAALGPLISIIGGLIGVFVTLTTVAAAANIAMGPLILIIAGIALVVGGLIFIWIKWGDQIKEFIGKLIPKIKNAFKSMGEFIKKTFEKIMNFLQPMIDFITKIIDKITKFIGKVKSFGKNGKLGSSAASNLEAAGIAAPAVAGQETTLATTNNNVVINIPGAQDPGAVAAAVNIALGELGS